MNDWISKRKRLLWLLPFFLLSGRVMASTDPVVVTVFQGSAHAIKKDCVLDNFYRVF